MKALKTSTYSSLPALFVLIPLSNCGNMQAVFSEQAYQQAVSLKVESLELMGEATEAYSMHKAEMEALKQKRLPQANIDKLKHAVIVLWLALPYERLPEIGSGAL